MQGKRQEQILRRRKTQKSTLKNSAVLKMHMTNFWTQNGNLASQTKATAQTRQRA